MQGRWSLTAPLFADAPAHGPRMRALAELLLERYGIVTRETVLAEGIPGGFSALYGELANLETLGTARRGYFVEGLGGAQFALPAAIERLRAPALRRARRRARAGRHRPGQPVRRDAAVAEARRRRRAAPARVPGAYVVTLDAEPVLYVERGGKGLLPLREPRRGVAAPGPRGAGRRTSAAAACRASRIERFDGEPVVGSPAGELLVELGFRQGPRKLTLSA